MRFKQDSLRDEFYQLPAMLQIMATWFEQLCISHFKIDPTVTRVFERVKGSSGVHEAGRAIDFRDEHAGKHVFTAEQVKFLVSEMNRRFPRTDGKKCMIHHKFQGGPAHFHLQLQLSQALASEDMDCYTVV